MKELFERIYAQKSWGDGKSLSGYGSDAEQTEVIRAALPDLFEELAVESVLDVPCGDFNWMRLLDLKLDYIGADVVPAVIERNQRLYGKSGRRFQILDITRDPLLKVDLILCRDLLVHLSFHDIKSALSNIFESGSRFVLTTTFPTRDINRDIETGQWRPLNLQRPPFSFPPPIRLITERCTEWGGQWADKCLGLWEVDAIAHGLERWVTELSSATAKRSPRVSVVIPTYNRATFIGQAVASALGQSYRDLEVIVVDDGSTDATDEVLHSFHDPRLICIRQENAGRSRARNVAINAARGEYITFLDSDDYYLPFKVELQVSLLDANREVGMAYTSAACIDDDGHLLNYTYRALLSGWIYPSIAFFVPHTVTLPTVMVRRDILTAVGLFDEAMERFEDIDMWRRIAKRAPILGIDDVTCHLRTHANNRLEAMDPAAIAAAMDYYVAKVFTEDADLEPSVLKAGARRLLEHYGSAMLEMPAFAATGEELLQKGRAHFNPMVSVVVPVYNGANYLGAAIESVLRQTYSNIEIVVVNDGSNDDGATERVALSYGKRVRYFFKSNGGVASALNRAISEARGEYISWLSHDDLYTADKIERQISFLTEQPEPGRCIVYGDYTVFSDNSGPGTPIAMPTVEPEDFRYFITVQNILHGCTLLIPKLAFERHGWFNEHLITTQDYDLWFRFAATERFVHLPGVVVRSRYHAEQGTRRMNDIMMAEADRLLTDFVENLTPEQIERGSSWHPIQGYLEIAEGLRKRNFTGAAARSVDLSRDAATSALEDLAQISLPELRLQHLSLKIRSLELKSQLRTRRTTQEQNLEALTSKVDMLHRQLQNVYASSSWRVTRPLRMLGRVLWRLRDRSYQLYRASRKFWR